MRIIAGTFRGRRLAAVPGSRIRPTRDRVREAVFNILESFGPFQSVLDLFAGSGALGLEAVSRWGGRAVFVENAPEALACLRANLQRLQVAERCRVIPKDLSRGLGFLSTVGPFDLVFLDPPYGKGWAEKVLTPLSRMSVLEEFGLVVLEHEFQEAVPETVGRWGLLKQRRYGRTGVSFYGSSTRPQKGSQ